MCQPGDSGVRRLLGAPNSRPGRQQDLGQQAVNLQPGSCAPAHLGMKHGSPGRKLFDKVPGQPRGHVGPAPGVVRTAILSSVSRRTDRFSQSEAGLGTRIKAAPGATSPAFSHFYGPEVSHALKSKTHTQNQTRTRGCQVSLFNGDFSSILYWQRQRVTRRRDKRGVGRRGQTWGTKTCTPAAGRPALTS